MQQSTEGIVVGRDEKIFAKVNSTNSSCGIWQRKMPTFLESWAEDLKWSRIRSFSYHIELDKLDELEDSLWSYFATWKTAIPDMAYWFAEDIRLIAQTFLAASHLKTAYLRLSPIYSDSEYFFRESESDLILISSYMGLPVEMYQTNIDSEDSEIQSLPLLDALFINKSSKKGQKTFYRLPPFDKSKRSFVMSMIASRNLH